MLRPHEVAYSDKGVGHDMWKVMAVLAEWLCVPKVWFTLCVTVAALGCGASAMGMLG